ncbi:2,3-dihydro-2,3-dihydroxybenzoate dehydrogenase [uncultured Mediterranean phage]|nr:2,3-dihydro-2,3-dihydroxybenzoate dehydrogenase [uncultured Mediterranean phage]
MVATLTTLNAALKEWYVSPLITQLNEEIDILNEFSKQSVSWSGSQAIFPVKTSRNSGVEYIDDGGNLPTAGNVGTERMVVTAQSLVARFQITNKSLKAAKKGGAGAFIGALELEMDGAKEAAKNHANRRATSGGRLAGFVHEKRAHVDAVGTDTGNAGEWIMRGDVQKVADMLAAAGGVQLDIDLIPYSTQSGVGTYADPAAYEPLNGANSVRVTAVNTVTGVLTLAALDSGGVDAPDTSNVTNGFAVGVHIKDTAVAVSNVLDREPVGLYGNIGLQTLHGLDRSQVSGTASTQTLRSNVLTQGNALSDLLTPLSLDRVQQVFDRVMNESGEEPDQIWVSPLFRNQYTTLFSGAQTLHIDGSKSTSADGGFNKLSYGGVPMKTSRHVDNGMLLFLKRKYWKVAELAPIGFADEDGRIINKVQGSARIEGFLEWDYNLVCCRPNAQCVLVGLTT